MGTILLIIILTVFLISCDIKGENGWAKIIELIFGLGIMAIAFMMGGWILTMIVSMIASL